MHKSVKLKHPLSVRQSLDRLSRPQKCQLPQNIHLPAASLVLVKSESRKFLCRLYYLSEVHCDKETAYVDDSVEMRKSELFADEIKLIHEVELISEQSLVEFRILKVHLHLIVNDLNLDVIRKAADLEQLTKSIAKSYTFCVDCEIKCNRNGIAKIRVEETDVDGFGTIVEDGVVEILSISIDSTFNLKNSTLGGLDNARESLENLININCTYMKNPELFTFKPECQAFISGPVGTGKSSLVHQVAKKLNCVLYEISSDVFQPLPGETERAIEKVFQTLKRISKIVKHQMTIVLIENVEIFCPKFNPNESENSHSSRVTSLIFDMLDEIARSESSIIVVGTTSKLELINPSVRKASRMGSCEINLDMPDELQRSEIIKLMCNQTITKNISSNLINFVSQSTPGFVGADLEILTQFTSRHLHTESLELNEINLQKAFELTLKSVVPSVMRENLGMVTRSAMKLDCIGGMEELKKYLITSVLGPLRYPEKFRSLGLRSPSGILLYGPSGCAKTTIVKCLAGETKMTLISVSSAEIYSPYVGEAEKFIVKLFNQARMNAPAILFFDEIDTIIGNRSLSGGSNDAHVRILSTLLTEIDGFACGDKKSVIVIGATNKPQMIDDALMRPGRFDKLIHIQAPDLGSRINILNFVTKNMPIDPNVDIKSIAERTHNFSGADLVNLCNEAALCAATKDLQSEIIDRHDFDDVLTYLSPSLTAKQIEFFKNYESFHRTS